jgi:RimJ/RimL family protein N-acetyltransferase
MQLRDGELELREWRMDDIPDLVEACNDPEIRYWIPMIPRPYTEDDARAFIGREVATPQQQFAISENGRAIGSIGITINDVFHNGHVGYWCAPSARGRGVTTRALRLLCRHALEDLQLERLELITDPDNHASQRVAQKVGFKREGVLRSHLSHPDGRRRDSVMFSLLPGELT